MLPLHELHNQAAGLKFNPVYPSACPTYDNTFSILRNLVLGTGGFGRVHSGFLHRVSHRHPRIRGHIYTIICVPSFHSLFKLCKVLAVVLYATRTLHTLPAQSTHNYSCSGKPEEFQCLIFVLLQLQASTIVKSSQTFL